MSQPTRAERVEWVDALFAAGYSHRQIAAELGVSRSYVRDLRYDPTGDKARERKERTQTGTCVDCGARTSYGKRGQGPSKRCQACSNTRFYEERLWTQEAIIEALRGFHGRYGKSPRATDFSPALARVFAERAKHPETRRQYEDVAARAEWEVLPHLAAVYREFGSLSKALIAAGLPDSPGSRYERGPDTRRRMSDSLRQHWDEVGRPRDLRFRVKCGECGKGRSVSYKYFHRLARGLALNRCRSCRGRRVWAAKREQVAA
jgi:hypothetical protein